MRMQRTLMVLVPVLVLAACGGALVSDPAAVPSKYPTYGVRPENLEVEPRKSPVAPHHSPQCLPDVQLFSLLSPLVSEQYECHSE